MRRPGPSATILTAITLVFVCRHFCVFVCRPVPSPWTGRTWPQQETCCQPWCRDFGRVRTGHCRRRRRRRRRFYHQSCLPTTSCLPPAPPPLLAEFDLEGLRSRLDEQGLAVATAQEGSVRSRKTLAERTKGEA